MDESQVKNTGELEKGMLDILQNATNLHPDTSIIVGDLVSSWGQRSFGLAVLVFSIPMIVPMPPGVPMIAGLVISLFGLQILFGRPYLWLPKWLRQKSINRNALLKAYTFTNLYLGWMLRLAKPRLTKLIGPKTLKISGGIFTVLGLLMVLPIPLIGNILPALSCTILATGLTERDGVVYSIGLLITVFTLGAMFLISVGTLSVLSHIF